MNQHEFCCISIMRDHVTGKKVNNNINEYRKSLVKYDEFNDEGYKNKEDNGFNHVMFSVLFLNFIVYVN